MNEDSSPKRVSLLQRLFRLLYGSDPVEFASAYGMTESVERLKAATKRSVFSSMAEQAAVGRVKESSVSLQRAIPMVGNSFKPFFVGHFIDRNGEVILTGRFTIHWFVKIFMTFWFGGITLFSLISVLAAVSNPQKAVVFPLFGLGMFAAGIGFVRLGKTFAKNDAAWLSNVIRGALSARSLNSTVSPDTVIPGIYSPQRPSLAVTIASLVLAVMGLAGLCLATLGIQSIHASPQDTVITYFPNMVSRYFAASFSAALLVLAYGIHRRRMFAWHAGLILLGGSWVYWMVQLSGTDEIPKNAALMVFFGIASLIVTTIWGRWWYAQRIHFHS